VVHGGRDPHTPISEVAELAAQVQDGRTLFFPEGGHSLHDDPTWMEAVHAAVLDLFSSAEAKASRTTPSEATGA
jgi:pimeloyl-ACP methyl ester carboxylesterase